MDELGKRMDAADFERLKAGCGLTESDAARLRDAGSVVEAGFPRVVDVFYEKLFADPEARRVLEAEPGRVERLRRALLLWIRELFGGGYDEAYFERRCNIGHVHVRVELPQRFMFFGMAVIRQELHTLLADARIDDAQRVRDALDKLLDLELAVMLETYREAYVERIRTADSKAVKRQLDEMEHMAQIGTLAASLAHEIKNPLAGISGAIQVLSSQLDRTHPHRASMGEILKQVERLDDTVKDLLSYARPRAPDLSPRDVGQTIRDCLTLLREDPILHRVDVHCKGLDAGIAAHIDPKQFEQVIANLLINAAQACDGSGRVTIELSARPSDVEIRVLDNGRGMSDETRARALEPFFTTKARGTGLGLSICQRIIEGHHGALRIESSSPRGTIIAVTLPRARGSTA
jgi:signal transduction histidine kinase